MTGGGAGKVCGVPRLRCLVPVERAERCFAWEGTWGGRRMHRQCEFQEEYSFFFLGLVPTSLLSDEEEKKRKKGEGPHTRAANATPPLRRPRPCQLLLSCGALPAVRDGLRTAVSAFGGFLRSSWSLCIRNSF